jgi:hypothetical protein
VRKESLVEAEWLLREAYDAVLDAFWDFPHDEADETFNLVTRRQFRVVIHGLEDLIGCVEAAVKRATK